MSVAVEMVEFKHDITNDLYIVVVKFTMNFNNKSLELSFGQDHPQ